MFYRVARIIVWLAFKIFFDMKVEGHNNIPKTGPAILASNHTSYLDPPAVGVATSRSVTFMARADLFAIPVLGFIIKHLGAFPVKRAKPDKSAIKKALLVLRTGGLLGVFPEGTRSTTGKLKALHPGMALIALKAQVPVVPVALIGTSRILPMHSIIPHISRLLVRFGRPLLPHEFPDQRLDKAAPEKLNKKVAARIEKLLAGR